VRDETSVVVNGNGFNWRTGRWWFLKLSGRGGYVEIFRMRMIAARQVLQGHRQPVLQVSSAKKVQVGSFGESLPDGATFLIATISRVEVVKLSKCVYNKRTI